MKLKLIRWMVCGALALTATIGGIAAFPATESIESSAAVVETEPQFDEKNIALTFANFTDPHVGYGTDHENLEEALREVQTYTSNKIDAIQFCGDQTQGGTADNVALFMSTFRKVFDPKQTPLIFSHGNHDTYWSGCMTTTQFAEAYGADTYTFDQADTDYRTGNRHVVVNGYHFLCVQIAQYTGQNNVNPVSAATEEWLRSTLDRLIAENPNQYVFVASHCPVPDTVYGSFWYNDDGPWGSSKELGAILDGYKQVVFFSGHLHYNINDERNINQSTYTQIQSGSLSDMVYDTKNYYDGRSVSFEERRKESQGMLVEVDTAGRIRIMRIDFLRNKQIKGYWYLDACKADGSHLNRYTAVYRSKHNTAPQFAPNATLNVEVNSFGAKITYPAATDDDMVFTYTVGVYKDGQPIQEIQSYSHWFIHPDLTTLPSSQTIDLTYNVLTPYTIQVVPTDSFGFAGKPLSYVVGGDSTTPDQPAVERDPVAVAVDERIAALGTNFTQYDIYEIRSIRLAIENMSALQKSDLKSYARFCWIEAEYYNRYHLSSDATKYAPKANELTSSSPNGWVSGSIYTGVSLSWSAADSTDLLGWKKSFLVDGLHVSLSNLQFSSVERTLSFVLSENSPVGKGVQSTTLQLNFASGAIYLGNGTKIGDSTLLSGSPAEGKPFDLSVHKQENGDYCLFLYTLSGTESFLLSADEMPSSENVYLALAPVSGGTTASVDITAVHGGDAKCEAYETIALPSDEDNKPSQEKPMQSGETSPIKDGIGITCIILGACLIGVSAWLVLRRKK